MNNHPQIQVGIEEIENCYIAVAYTWFLNAYFQRNETSKFNVEYLHRSEHPDGMVRQPCAGIYCNLGCQKKCFIILF